MKSETVVTIDDLPSDVIDAVKRGRKIEAIKMLRLATGLGLANAKVLVDAAARRHGIPPVQPALVSGDQAAGRLSGILLLILLGIGAWFYFQS